MPGTRIRDKSRASREDRHGLTRRLNERAFLILYFVRGGVAPAHHDSRQGLVAIACDVGTRSWDQDTLWNDSCLTV